MGSGRGKSKRVSALSQPVIPKNKFPVFDHKKWEEFLQEHSLENESIYGYYYGKEDGGRISEAEVLDIFNQLFSDALTMEVIVLPDMYRKEDFEFRCLSIGDGVSQATLYEVESTFNVEICSYYDHEPPFQGMQMWRTTAFLGAINDRIKECSLL